MLYQRCEERNPIPPYSSALSWDITPLIYQARGDFFHTPLIATAAQTTRNSVLSDIAIPPPSMDSPLPLPGPQCEAKILTCCFSLQSHSKCPSISFSLFGRNESPNRYPLPHTSTLGSFFLPPPFSVPSTHIITSSLTHCSLNAETLTIQILNTCSAPFCIVFTHFMLLLAS